MHASRNAFKAKSFEIEADEVKSVHITSRRSFDSIAQAIETRQQAKIRFQLTLKTFNSIFSNRYEYMATNKTIYSDNNQTKATKRYGTIHVHTKQRKTKHNGDLNQFFK